MSLITIDAEKCNHDGLCVQACPVHIIEQQKGAVPFENPELTANCINCGHCVAICPTGALSHETLPADNFMPQPELPGSDSVENLLLGRRSVRIFRKKPVSREQLEKLLDVARKAPTASNSQNLSWVMIEDANVLDRVRELTLGWMGSDPKRARYLKAADLGKDVVLRGGTALAVACCPADYLWTETDCAIALTYMELLAASMQLGACWGGLVTAASWNVEGLNEVLGVPEGHKVGGALMLGQPARQYSLVPPRNPLRVTWK